jgi:hypothetical protein
MGSKRLWCRVSIVGLDGTQLLVRNLAGSDAPDLETVDELARLVLTADRFGGDLIVTELADELRELLDLVGLRVEVERQTKPRKEPFGLEIRQEETHPDDQSI